MEFGFQIWVRESRPQGCIGHFRPKHKKLDAPDEIVQLSGQTYKFIWKGFPIDHHSRYKLKYKVDLYGDNKITIPGRYDKDGWAELWL